MSETPNGSGVGLSLRELVLEVRNDVKTLDAKIDKIDRQGSIGTREELADHENRIGKLEDTGLLVRGAWVAVGVTASVLAGAAGLLLGVLAYF